MISSESVATLRGMARALVSSAPISAGMLQHVANDLESDGPIGKLIGDHPDAGKPLACFRAVAGVRYLMLTGRAPEFEAHLKGIETHVDDPLFDARTWELFRGTLLGNPAEILSAMDRPVQQHQPDRAAVLLDGLRLLGAPKIRLLELGACAGLNLLVDRYRWFGPDWQWGDQDSPVRLAAKGARPPEIEIIERAGCDQAPRDPANSDDVNILRSFVPYERVIEQMDLDDAIALAARSMVRVDKADAGDWLIDELRRPVADRSVYTVVWHSLFWEYLKSDEQIMIEETLIRAAGRMRLARIAYEPYSWLTAPRLQVTLYS